MAGRRMIRDKAKFCSVAGCGKPYRTGGYCQAHYLRWYRHGDPLGGGTSRGEPHRYFRETVLPFTGDECLTWPYNRSSVGYGMLWVDGRPQLVHRLACEAVHGAAPLPGNVAAHNCGQGHEGCCNPRHLEWKTQSENLEDRVGHGTHTRGERGSNAKLTNIQALAIKQSSEPEDALALKYGVAKTTIRSLRNGNSWRWLNAR